MSNDLISNNFVENVEKDLIKKTLGLTKLVLNMAIIYSILDIYLSLQFDNSNRLAFFHNTLITGRNTNDELSVFAFT